MTYINCPVCGGRLLEGEEGSCVKLKCNKCGKLVRVKIKNGEVILSVDSSNELLKKSS